MKKIITSVTCVILAAFLVLGIYVHTLSPQSVFGKEIDEAIEYNIIKTLKEEPSHLKCNGVKTKATKTYEQVEAEVKSLFSNSINFKNYYILECDSLMPYFSDDGDKVLWYVTMHVAGIPDYKRIMYVQVVYDELSGKILRFYSDRVAKLDDGTEFYEDVPESKDITDKKVFDEVYEKAESYTKLYAEYLGVKVKAINFDHINLDRYTFKAELVDSMGESIIINVSYNPIKHRYNFNF